MPSYDINILAVLRWNINLNGFSLSSFTIKPTSTKYLQDLSAVKQKENWYSKSQ